MATQKAPSDAIPVSHFAKAMGVDNMTIAKYIKKGWISGDAVVLKPNGKVKGVHFDLAKAQYIDARQAVLVKFRKSNDGAPGEPGSATQRRKGKLTPAEDAELDRVLSLGQSFPAGGVEATDPDNEDVSPRMRRQRIRTEPGEEHPPLRPQPHGGHLKSGDGDPEKAETRKSLNQLALREAELKVEKAELELAKMKGEYVSRSDVERALFTAGQELRVAMEAVPGRVAPHVFAADSEHEVASLIAAEINLALTAVADLANRPITTERAPGRTTGTR